MFYYIYYVLFNDNSYKAIVIIAVYDKSFLLRLSRLNHIQKEMNKRK